MDKRGDAYSNLRIEEVGGFCYIEHTVIGWDFPNLSRKDLMPK